MLTRMTSGPAGHPVASNTTILMMADAIPIAAEARHVRGSALRRDRSGGLGRGATFWGK